jgi:hypothetical protein
MNLTAAQLDELERYLKLADAAGQEMLDAYVGGLVTEPAVFRASVLRELLAIGRRELLAKTRLEELRAAEVRVPCTCGVQTVLPGGAYREPSGFTHYSDQGCGPDILGEDDRCPACGWVAHQVGHDPKYACHRDHPEFGRYP